MPRRKLDITMFGPDADSWEAPWLTLEVGDYFASFGLVIEYIDTTGNPSRRLVENCRLYFRGDTTYLGGTCRLREQFRSFQVDRIVTCSSPLTGEIYKNLPQLFAESGEQNFEPPHPPPLTFAVAGEP